MTDGEIVAVATHLLRTGYRPEQVWRWLEDMVAW